MTPDQEKNFLNSLSVGNHDNGLGGKIIDKDLKINDYDFYNQVDEYRKVWLTSSDELMTKIKHESIYFNLLDFLQDYRLKFHSNNDSMI